MTYALVENDQVVRVAGQPTNLRRLADGALVLWSQYITAAELAACGWFQVIDAARPADTATHTHDRTLQVGTQGAFRVVRVVWVQRPWTQAELAARAKAAAVDARNTELANAIDTLRTWAAQARGTTVTTANHLATTQTVVTRLGTFFDRFADDLENRFR
jgi:hypothetical protein